MHKQHHHHHREQTSCAPRKPPFRAEDVKAQLLAKGIRPTQQRLEILKFIQGSRQHPTADTIYRALVKDMPTISRTTVYNTLKMLLKKGIVASVNITGTEVHFDCATEGHHHHHLLCETCGKIIDVEVVCPNFARKEICGHQIKELHGYFKGICADCARK